MWRAGGEARSRAALSLCPRAAALPAGSGARPRALGGETLVPGRTAACPRGGRDAGARGRAARRAVPGAAVARPAGLRLGAAARRLPGPLRVLGGGQDGEVREQEPDGGAARPAALRAQPLHHRQPPGPPARRRAVRPAPGRAGKPQPQRQPPAGRGGRRPGRPARPAAAGPRRQPAGGAQPAGLRAGQPAGGAGPARGPAGAGRSPWPGRPAAGWGPAQPQPLGAGRQRAAPAAHRHAGRAARPAAPGPQQQLAGGAAERLLPGAGSSAEPQPQRQLAGRAAERHPGPVARAACPAAHQPQPQHLGVRLCHRGHGGLAEGERPGGGQGGPELRLPREDGRQSPAEAQHVRAQLLRTCGCALPATDFLRLLRDSLGSHRGNFPPGFVLEPKRNQKVDAQHQRCLQGSHGGISLQV